MKKNSIASVLGCLTILLVLSGCSSSAPTPITISASPVDRPRLELPNIDPIRAREVNWIVITPENAEEVFKKIEASGKPIVVFALLDNGYEALSLNLNDLRTYIQQQKIIITAYENYYTQSTAALDEANRRMIDNANTASQATVAPANRSILGVFN